MRLTHIALLVSLSVACINACSNSPTPPTEKKAPVDQLVGRVAAVYQNDNYLLVQKYRSFPTDIDAIFYSRGEDGSVNTLTMTGQKLGQFYVADLKQGSYTLNDPVFMRDLRNKSQVDENKANAQQQLKQQLE
ncbi:hypothetical protein [Rubritalea tangerina]|uniref:DUF4369 domain-containing protein n=1 Tax=Rubritalea tangerina TaxID=430798 RepID=A0ABW4ZBU7_9BACT